MSAGSGPSPAPPRDVSSPPLFQLGCTPGNLCPPEGRSGYWLSVCTWDLMGLECCSFLAVQVPLCCALMWRPSMVAGTVGSTRSRRILVQTVVIHDLLGSMLTKSALSRRTWSTRLVARVPLLPRQVVALVIALVLIGTGSKLAAVVVGNSRLFSTLLRCLLSATRTLRRLERCQ
jgi:hypothetical protein